MTILIGTDEAGYGPNLGPLTITATAWEFPDGTTAEDCWTLLADSISSRPTATDCELQVGDSKNVYSSRGSLEALERTVLVALRMIGASPATLGQLGKAVAGNLFANQYSGEPFRPDDSLHLPRDTSPAVIESAAAALTKTMEDAGVSLLAIQSCVLYPREFNRRVQAEQSKGRVLSTATLQLVANIIVSEQSENALVICDKHGGRNRYDELLSETFGDQLVFRIEEGRALSRYRLGGLEFRFQTKAEQHLPVALASMVSKYLRELAMIEFNVHWSDRVPGIKPTMGYPVDATRFLEEIEANPDITSIDRNTLWRCR